jgi:ABC-type branched-subunit amino acid transport system ATPase component
MRHAMTAETCCCSTGTGAWPTPVSPGIRGNNSPNGAGKSTAINLLTGHIRPTTGRVLVDGQDLTAARPWRLAHAGVARTFQIVKPFRGMTVADNVAVAALFSARSNGVRHTVAAARRAALETLDRVGLGGKSGLAPAELSVADACRLELARRSRCGHGSCCSTRYSPGCAHARSTPRSN